MINADAHHKKVVSYFKESRLGYDLVLGGVKHFGYYPDGINNIKEKEAQILMQDLLAGELHIKKNQIILDAGCGQGFVSAYLARKYQCRIKGITIVPFEVKKAKKLAERSELSHSVEYSLMDYSNTTFKDNEFDAIYTMESFVHSPDAYSTLKEFLRVLKPDGKLVMFEYTISDDSEFTGYDRKMADMIISRSAMESLKNMRHDSFAELLKSAGFKSVRHKDISEHMLPSLKKLNRLAKIPYFFVNLLRLNESFINVTAAAEIYKLANRGLFKYKIFTARKPSHI